MNLLENLLSSSIDEVFQKWNISTINFMHNDLEKEVIRKKDGIRVLVGEKYRDFVDVSEKIYIMNEITGNTTKEIKIITSSLDTLSNPSRDERKLSRTNYLKSYSGTKNELRVAVLRKLLIDIENQIWIEIENKTFTNAATSLQFAVYTRTILDLEIVRQNEKNGTIISEVWDFVLRFPVVINQFIEKELRSVNLTSHVGCECFCSVALLQNLSCANVIEKFLTLRMETLEFFLCKGSINENVRSRIHNSFLTIVKTLEILYSCFRETPLDDVGEYWKCLKKLTDSKNPIIFCYIDADRIAMSRKLYWPLALKNFNVKMNDLAASLNLSEFRKMVGHWIKNVRDRIVAYLPSYLNLINSLQSLNALKQNISIDDDSWTHISEYFDLKESFFLWREMYAPHIDERVKILLSQRWNVSFARVRHKIENYFQDTADTNKCEAEYNLHTFLWMAADSTWSKTSSTPSIGLSRAEDLRVKVLGLSPNTEKLCNFIESLVSDIVNDFSNIYSAKDTESQNSFILRTHQKHSCIAFVEKLIHLSGELLNVEDISEKMMMFLARFLSSISFFCPSMKQCVLLDDQGNEWHLLTVKLSEESLHIWRKWSLRVMFPILKELESFDRNILSATYKLKYLTKWATIKLTEEDNIKEDAYVELRVPLQASISVQNTVNELAEVIGRTLPPTVILMEMKDNVVAKILDRIEAAGKHPINHIVRLQFLFDVKYLTLLLVPVENDKLHRKCKKTVIDLEMKIDPVDLDLISPILSSNVRVSVYNTQSIFGTLRNESPSVTIEQFVDNSEDPSVIYTATNDTLSFPLFPVSSTHSG